MGVFDGVVVNALAYSIGSICCISRDVDDLPPWNEFLELAKVGVHFGGKFIDVIIRIHFEIVQRCSNFGNIHFLSKPLLEQLFIWKHNIYKQMRCSIVWGKERALGARWGVEIVPLIKSLISAGRNNALRVQGCQVQLKVSADISPLLWGDFEGIKSAVSKNIVLPYRRC